MFTYSDTRTTGKNKTRKLWAFLLILAFTCGCLQAFAQVGEDAEHRRGRLWENIKNDGWIGHGGAWDYLTSAPLGLYPGFAGFFHPVGNEFDAVNTYANANFHNFRSGFWIVGKDLMIPGQPPNFRPTPAAYEFFVVGGHDYGGQRTENREPIRLIKNYQDSTGFNPLLPEEQTFTRVLTNLGVTVTRRSYVWSYPGFRDFIIYDYVFKNTGDIVSVLTEEVVPNTQDFQQTLRDIYFVFHSAISVSTKSQINFHSELTAVQAGAFGWKPSSYHDYYHLSDDGTLAFSTNYNGGAAPVPWDPEPLKDNEAWKTKFGNELQSPAAFGWLALYADPTGAAPRTSPKPDVLRIDVHKGGRFQGKDLDFEFFRATEANKKAYYEFAMTPDLQPQLGNEGNRFNFYTYSYGPYTMAPGDSVRIILAEIAGVMDYNEVINGDPNGYFPDSTIAAIERNAEWARKAVSWGIGATVDGIPLAADAPEPPPSPGVAVANASQGSEEAVILVTWDDVAETATITDGSGSVFYDNSDLDGYRVYRSTDFQYTSDTEPPVLRGAAWTLMADIPKSQFNEYWDTELNRYKFEDRTVEFGRRYGYYVSAYNNDPRPWTSANGTVVSDLPTLESGDHNRSQPASALAGPVSSFDIYVAPNPFVFGDPDRSFGLNDPYKIEFRNLPERATIRIYTISGDLIRTLKHGPDEIGNVFGSMAWDQKSDSGLLVAPGLYIYHVDSETEGLDNARTGKLMIIR